MTSQGLRISLRLPQIKKKYIDLRCLGFTIIVNARLYSRAQLALTSGKMSKRLLAGNASTFPALLIILDIDF